MFSQLIVIIYQSIFAICSYFMKTTNHGTKIVNNSSDDS